MKYVIYILFFFCCISCNKKAIDYTCKYVAIQDNYPKGANNLDYERQICCILKFHNIGQDSIYLPFERTGMLIYRSRFYIEYNRKISTCPARFWGYQTNTHVVAPGEIVRIGVVIYPWSLDDLGLKENTDIRDLSKKINIFYKYNSADATLNHLKTPKLKIQTDSTIELIYDAKLF